MDRCTISRTPFVVCRFSLIVLCVQLLLCYPFFATAIPTNRTKGSRSPEDNRKHERQRNGPEYDSGNLRSVIELICVASFINIALSK